MFIPFDPDVATDDLIKQIKISDCRDLFCDSESKKKLVKYKKLKINFYNSIEYKVSKTNNLKKFKVIKNNFLLCFTSGSTGSLNPLQYPKKQNI